MLSDVEMKTDRDTRKALLLSWRKAKATISHPLCAVSSSCCVCSLSLQDHRHCKRVQGWMGSSCCLHVTDRANAQLVTAVSGAPVRHLHTTEVKHFHGGCQRRVTNLPRGVDSVLPSSAGPEMKCRRPIPPGPPNGCCIFHAVKRSFSFRSATTRTTVTVIRDGPLRTAGQKGMEAALTADHLLLTMVSIVQGVVQPLCTSHHLSARFSLSTCAFRSFQPWFRHLFSLCYVATPDPDAIEVELRRPPPPAIICSTLPYSTPLF